MFPGSWYAKCFLLWVSEKFENSVACLHSCPQPNLSPFLLPGFKPVDSQDIPKPPFTLSGLQPLCLCSALYSSLPCTATSPSFQLLLFFQKQSRCNLPYDQHWPKNLLTVCVTYMIPVFSLLWAYLVLQLLVFPPIIFFFFFW